MSSKKLPVVPDQASSLNTDGSRNYVHPADVHGRFTSMRWVVFAVLILVYLLLPVIKIADRPAVFLDVQHRRFFLFGGAFNAQDFWLVFFILSGIAFLLIVITTLWGRIWCGYACPQTVFLEGVYRRVERFLEGPRNERLKRNAGPWNFDKSWRKVTKHAFFVALSLFFSHFFLSYFVSLPSLMAMVKGSPSAHPEAFVWMAAMSVILYVNFAWFREQMCLIICPYGRIQSTLTDRETLVIGYDKARGEPRGKKGAVGDCVDCGRCVQVCPTGIDIRNGLQLECIGCASCVDACDEVMVKMKKPVGLVRYDSQKGFEEKAPHKFLRPRLFIYAAVLTVWAIGFTFAVRSREPFAANLLRPPGGAAFMADAEFVTNVVQVHLVNKTDGVQTYHLAGVGEDFEFVTPSPEVELEGGRDRQVHFIVRLPRGQMRAGLKIRVDVTDSASPPVTRHLEADFLGPT